MRTLLLCITAISCFTITSRASAIEPLTALQLQEVCADARANPESPEARLCIYYVKGFLDGAVATDGRVAENVASEIDEQESFAERAIRTRVINRLNKFGPSVYAEFCVGQPVVYDSLRRHYPCSAQ